MAKSTPSVADSIEVGTLAPLRDSFLRHLRAENKSPSTIVTYAKGGFSSASTWPHGACHGL